MELTNRRFQILLKCTWNIFQNKAYVRPSNFCKLKKIEIIKGFMSWVQWSKKLKRNKGN